MQGMSLTLGWGTNEEETLLAARWKKPMRSYEDPPQTKINKQNEKQYSDTCDPANTAEL